MSIDENLNQTVYRVIDRLWQQRLPSDETIGLIQQIADEKFPVYLSLKNVDNPVNRKNKASTITFKDLSLKLKAEYEREKMEDDHEDLEIIQQAKMAFEDIRMDVKKIIDDCEQRMFHRFFAIKITTNFLTHFHGGDLSDNPMFMDALEYVLRSYAITNKKELMRLALDQLKKMSLEIPRNVKGIVERMTNLEKEVIAANADMTTSRIHEGSSGHFPTQIIDRNKGLFFFREALSHLYKDPVFELAYSGTRDGFDAKRFHALCEGRGPTLTIVETRDRRIFGGYAHQPWRSTNSYQPDDNAFLFSWDWKEVYKQTQNREHALFHNSNHGPAFGGGHDLAISSQCNMNSSSSMDINVTYSTRGRDRNTISGGRNFTVANIEVFLVLSQQQRTPMIASSLRY